MPARSGWAKGKAPGVEDPIVSERLAAGLDAGAVLVSVLRSHTSL
jgi:hypothetical protein